MFKSLIIKIIAKLLLGFSARKSSIDQRQIRTILINRSDRIGDAVISLPFLLELNKRFDLTVLTSQYNDFILRPFLKTKVVTANPPKLGEVLIYLAGNLFSKSPKPPPGNKARYDLYLDLVGIRGLQVFINIRKDNLCSKYAGFNLGPWNRLLDYSYRGSVELTRTGMCSAYRRFIKESLGIDIDIPDHLDLSGQMRTPSDLELPEKYLLVNISGFNKFRGPSPRSFAEMLNALDYSGKIVIMDEPGQPNIPEFKRYTAKDNLIFLQKDYTVWELLEISGKAEVYIGSDLGITHMLQIPVDAVIFFATGSYSVWKPCSKNDYRQSRIGDITVEDTVNSVGLRKKIIYRKVWCRPCYDIGCKARACITGMGKEITGISRQIQSMLKERHNG